MTKQIMVGGVAVGGGAPVTIQSMCNTKTEDAGATIEQILRLEQAGCEIVRVTVPTPEAAVGRSRPSRTAFISRSWRIFTLTTALPSPRRSTARTRSASTPATSAARTV